MEVGNRRSAGLDVSSRVPRRNLGMITLAGAEYPLLDCGPWVASTTVNGVGIDVTYQAGNLVTSDGDSYVALPVTGNTGKQPPNTSYWQLFRENVKYLRGDRTWVEVPHDLEVVIDGLGAAITTGIKGDARIDFDCTITGWTLLADQAGSIVIDIWRDTLANYPPTVADTITGSDEPTLSSQASASSTALTGWTTTVTAGDCLRFNVDSASTVERVTLVLALDCP